MRSFRGRTRRSAPSPLPSRLPWEDICERCLAIEPQDRFSSAEALADALDGFAGARPAGKYRWRAVGTLGVILLALTGSWFAWSLWGTQAIGTDDPGENGRSGEVAPGPTSAVCFSPDGRLLASGGADAKVRLWKVGDDLEEVAVLDQIAPVRSLAFSSSGKKLVVGCDNGTTRFWDLSQVRPREGLVVPGHAGPVTCLALSSDEKILVTGGADGTTRVYLDPRPETQAAVIPKATETVCSVTLNSTADKLLVGLGNGPTKPCELYLWHIVGEKGRPRLNNGGRAVLGTVEDVRAIAASPDHSVILAATPNKIVVWADLRVVGSFDRHTATITCVALAPDKLHAVSGDEGGNVLVWNVKDLREVRRQKGPGVRSVAVSPDRTMVAVGGVDGSVRLWRMAKPHQ